MNFSEKKINAAKSGDMRLYSKTNLLLSQNLPLSVFIHKYVVICHFGRFSDSAVLLRLFTTYYDILRYITTYYDILRHITTFYDIYDILGHITTYYDILRHITTYYDKLHVLLLKSIF